MKKLPIIIVLLLVAGLAGWIIAGQPGAAENQETNVEATDSLSDETVLASVGDHEITAGSIKEFLDARQIPEASRGRVRYQVLQQLIGQQLTDAFLGDLDVEPSEEDVNAVMADLNQQAQRMGMDLATMLKQQGMGEDDIRDQAKIRAALDQAQNDEKAAKYVQSHKKIFSGDGINGVVIFSQIPFYRETRKLEDARAELAQAAKKISAGQATVDQVMQEHPQWQDMKIEARALNEMHPALALAAAETEVGKVSKPVYLGQGFAVLHVTDEIPAQTVLEGKARQMLSRDGAQPAAESVAKLVKEHPEYFDGTQVQASHILLSVDPESTPEQREEKKKKLLEIAKDIREGETTFAEAAKQHSACPSKSEGGDLGLFTFEKMATPFSKAAFGAEIGTVTDIVETRFGYHIIKVTKVVEPAHTNRDAAKDFLGWQVQRKLFHQPFETPIKITEAGEQLAQAAAAQPPMPRAPRRPAPKDEDF